MSRRRTCIRCGREATGRSAPFCTPCESELHEARGVQVHRDRSVLAQAMRTVHLDPPIAREADMPEADWA